MLTTTEVLNISKGFSYYKEGHIPFFELTEANEERRALVGVQEELQT